MDLFYLMLKVNLSYEVFTCFGAINTGVAAPNLARRPFLYKQEKQGTRIHLFKFLFNLFFDKNKIRLVLEKALCATVLI